jgi:hypothetical protein
LYDLQVCVECSFQPKVQVQNGEGESPAFV